MQNGSGQQYDENGESGILEIGQLHFHGPELDPPSDGRVCRRRLEADRLPVGRLDILDRVSQELNVTTTRNAPRSGHYWSCRLGLSSLRILQEDPE